jgi:hypothetical protein
MVITDEEIQDGVAGTSCHGLDDLIWDWWNTQVADSDSIEGLEIMDKLEGTILLLDAESAGAVGGVRALVHACGNLLLE